MTLFYFYLTIDDIRFENQKQFDETICNYSIYESIKEKDLGRFYFLPDVIILYINRFLCNNEMKFYTKTIVL